MERQQGCAAVSDEKQIRNGWLLKKAKPIFHGQEILFAKICHFDIFIRKNLTLPQIYSQKFDKGMLR
jgi:hypothetical protein